MGKYSDSMVCEALATYWRLRHRGQTSLLARLSVEAQFSGFTVQQRRDFHYLLAGGAELYDAPPTGLLNWRDETSSADFV
jgi:hypothetical protein